jgi:hypothetical protein
MRRLGYRTALIVTVLWLCATLGGLAGCGDDCDDAAPTTSLLVGSAKRDITPSETTAPPDGQVYLGGYGIGPVRRSTGVLAPIFVRALVVSNGTDIVAFAENETQGAFAAYKTGAFGLIDIAAAVEAATGGRIPRTHVIIGSDHSHAGPDTTGVWGGLPDVYLQYLADQTVGAITDALAALRPARLLVGTADATDLLRSQFNEPPNDRVDGELRVLIAQDRSGGAHSAALINYAAHSTVMGSENTLISADWPGPVASDAERTLGVETAVVMLADCGRTQPNDGSVPGDTDPERLQSYADAVSERVREAAAHLTEIRGTEIAVRQLFLRERFGNPNVPFELLGELVSRSAEPPWTDGDVVGTLVSAARIGNLLLAGMPGEGYPAIQFALEDLVSADEHFIFGLANDQLGYLIAPESGYPQVQAAFPDNDNALFNVSPAIGDHVMCTLLKATRATGLPVGSDPELCETWAGEDNTLPF